MKEYQPVSDGHDHDIERIHGGTQPLEAFALGPAETTLPLDSRLATEIVPESPAPPYTPLFQRWRIKPTPLITVAEEYRRMHSQADIDDYKLTMREHAASWQEHMLGKYPSQTEGLDYDRATAFVGSLGLRCIPTIIRPMTDSENISRDIEMGLARPRNYGDSHGYYEHTFEIACVLRDKAYEAAYGPGYTEAVIVHELAHGSTTANELLYPQGSNACVVQPSRTGFTVAALSPHSPPGFRGVFLEEGFAARIEGRYIVEALDRPHGFTNETEDTIPWDDVHMATRYGRERQGSTRFPLDAPAGMAIDLLIAKDPVLEPALLEARTNVEAHREVVGRLNAIQPGLYAALRDNYNDLESFLDGLRLVEAAVHSR